MSETPPTVRRGAHGDIIEALHDRLRAAGFPVQGDPAASFGAATEETVRVFQQSRHLQVDGICGPDTWSALAEQVFRLGDRLLASRKPMLRGDDVRTLQLQLNRLGFDPGKIDGIFGPQTLSALTSFQKDAAIPADGICGPATTLRLQQLGGLSDGEIAGIRELETLAATPRQLAGRRVFIASRPAAKALVHLVAEALRARQVVVDTADDLTVDATAAPLALAFDADVSLLLQLTADDTWRCAYYGSGRYHSFRGAAIAHSISHAFGADCQPSGAEPRTIGFLRETQMPAVIAQVNPDELHQRTADAIAHGICAGFETPPEIAPN